MVPTLCPISLWFLSGICVKLGVCSVSAADRSLLGSLSCIRIY